MIKKIMIMLMVVLIVPSVYSVRNPAAVYCEELGYTYTIEKTEEGENGICNLPDGSSVSAWDFLKGKVGQEYSHCALRGFEIKTIENSEKCAVISSYECAVCVRNDGEEIEVTTLMNLNFKESVCGDGQCIILEENYKNCPQDCDSGEEDYYCDKVSDGKCDSDCDRGGDIDCPDTIMSESGEIIILSQGQTLEPGEETLSQETETLSSESNLDSEKGKNNYPLIIIGLVILLSVIISTILIHTKNHHRKAIRENDTSKLKQYINSNLMKGYSKVQIKQALQRIGWKKESIDKAFKNIKR